LKEEEEEELLPVLLFLFSLFSSARHEFDWLVVHSLGSADSFYSHLLDLVFLSSSALSLYFIWPLSLFFSVLQSVSLSLSLAILDSLDEYFRLLRYLSPTLFFLLFSLFVDFFFWLSFFSLQISFSFRTFFFSLDEKLKEEKRKKKKTQFLYSSFQIANEILEFENSRIPSVRRHS